MSQQPCDVFFSDLRFDRVLSHKSSGLTTIKQRDMLRCLNLQQRKSEAWYDCQKQIISFHVLCLREDHPCRLPYYYIPGLRSSGMLPYVMSIDFVPVAFCGNARRLLMFWYLYNATKTQARCCNFLCVVRFLPLSFTFLKIK